MALWCYCRTGSAPNVAHVTLSCIPRTGYVDCLCVFDVRCWMIILCGLNFGCGLARTERNTCNDDERTSTAGLQTSFGTCCAPSSPSRWQARCAPEPNGKRLVLASARPFGAAEVSAHTELATPTRAVPGGRRGAMRRGGGTHRASHPPWTTATIPPTQTLRHSLAGTSLSEPR